jgi:hypothetical protein
MSEMTVLVPELPTSAMVLPGGTQREKPRKTETSGREEYAKSTLGISNRPATEDGSQEEDGGGEIEWWSMILKMFAAATRAFANAAMLGADWSSARPSIMTENMVAMARPLLVWQQRVAAEDGELGAAEALGVADAIPDPLLAAQRCRVGPHCALLPHERLHHPNLRHRLLRDVARHTKD